MDNYTERLELPDGQYGVFRTRIGYAGALAIRKAIAKEENDIVFIDAVMRAFLVKATLKDFETGELLVNIESDAVDRGEVDVVDQLQIKALQLYTDWKAVTDPKAPAATEPETDATETSSDSPHSGRSKRKTKT